MPLVVTRCTPRLSFYKRSTPTAHLFYNLMVEVHLEFLIGVRWKCKLWIEEFRYFGEIKNSFTVYIWWRDNRIYFCYLRMYLEMTNMLLASSKDHVISYLICLSVPFFVFQDHVWAFVWFSALCEKCPNTEFFLVRVFPHSDWIRRDTEYSVRLRENTDQKKFRIWTLFTQWQWEDFYSLQFD